MPHKHEVELLARYNQWMNRRTYALAAALPPAELHADRGAFFGSVHRTLHHILVADTIWLKRFAAHPAAFAALQPLRALPASRTDPEAPPLAFETLHAARIELDGTILGFAAEANEADYAVPLAFANRRGERFEQETGLLVLHFFNHQTHHRGQVTTLFSQMGLDIGATDFNGLVPNRATGDA